MNMANWSEKCYPSNPHFVFIYPVIFVLWFLRHCGGCHQTLLLTLKKMLWEAETLSSFGSHFRKLPRNDWNVLKNVSAVSGCFQNVSMLVSSPGKISEAGDMYLLSTCIQLTRNSFQVSLFSGNKWKLCFTVQLCKTNSRWLSCLCQNAGCWHRLCQTPREIYLLSKKFLLLKAT